MDDTTPARKRGRRAGDAQQTRRAILDAARAEFAASGFTATSVRAVARRAEVDPALIAHHFGSKQALFLAAHEIPDDPLFLVGDALAAAPEDRGEVLARTFLRRFIGDPRGIGISLIRSASADESAARLLRDTIGRALLTHAAGLAGDDDDAPVRVALASALMVGVAFHTRILRVDALEPLDMDELAARLGPALQAVLVGARGASS
ncbi:TetR/AcrR family transcriptional regulator [Agromyces kandeliae]|uniref:TetR family transcriptional regulator n=1 Tax=Agromyces kandeliae TaxID=2666141 RepID=A0A6L5QWK8_9MICO|nr:TetR/AcrR family transcriptional regulator [Agromyces kandeliae]MRX42131.1 TetR family transcriptional regulator [Agromyces kandeliae]